MGLRTLPGVPRPLRVSPQSQQTTRGDYQEPIISQEETYLASDGESITISGGVNAGTFPSGFDQTNDVDSEITIRNVEVNSNVASTGGSGTTVTLFINAEQVHQHSLSDIRGAYHYSVDLAGMVLREGDTVRLRISQPAGAGYQYNAAVTVFGSS